MRRILIRILAAVAILAGVFFVLDRVSLFVPIAADGTSGMASAIPACDGRALAEGFTYKFRDPRRGEVVAIHAQREAGRVTPDPDSRDLALASRVIGVPGDQVVGRAGRVYVNGIKVDDILTPPFKLVDLAGDRFFVLGDNRSVARDSRAFGPVADDAIFGRVFLVFWPLGDFGPPEGRHAGRAPGELCGPG
jgi:signal peptidase I